MKLFPNSEILKKHIDHYWIVRASIFDLCANQQLLFAYPGITPDMLMVLDGYYSYQYQGKKYIQNANLFFCFIHEKMTVDLSHLKSFILIKFKSRALSSLLPFIKQKSEAIMRNPIIDCDELFDTNTTIFSKHVRKLDNEGIVDELDNWFMQLYHKDREGLIIDIAEEVSKKIDIQTILKATNYSQSTLERHFKRDTGLTPKKYQSLQRYKLAIREIYETRNTDWQYYVNKYGYFDQSHFIKEIKKYTSFTPNQLLHVQSFVGFRPM